MRKPTATIPSREAVAHALREEMERSAHLRSQSALARRSGVAQSTIGRILRAEVDAQADSLHRLARALGVPAGRLFGERAAGGDITRRGSSPVSGGGGDVTPLKDGVVPVPLLATAQVRTIVTTTKQQQRFPERDEIEAESWLLCPKKCGPRTFALRVEGAAMADYNHGDIIFVDPDVAATPGRLVVALMHLTNEVLFRQLVVEGDRRYLRATNPEWPGAKITPLQKDDMIVGVVIGKWVDA